MENASKALIFAGGLLISMLIVAALIFTISQVRNLKSQEQQAEQTDEVAEYNNKFNKYASENLFGVDLISLCNEVSNYNAKESDNKYYHEIELIFNFSGTNPLGDYIKTGEYKYINDNKPPSGNTPPSGIPQSKNLLTQYKAFEDSFNGLAKTEVSGNYTVKQVAEMRSDEVKTKIGNLNSTMQDNISKYNTLKASFTEFKTKKFKGEITNQDNTGRITQMTFTSK